MKNPIRKILSVALLFTGVHAFAQVDTAHRYNPNRDANPGKVLLDTARIWPAGPNNRSPIRSIPDTTQKNLPRKMETPDRVVQPGDTMKSKNPLHY